MKGGQNLRDLQQQKKDLESWVKPQLCHICHEQIPGAYGHSSLNCGVVWSCSKTCEVQVQQLKQGEYRDAIQRATKTQVGGNKD